MKSLDPRVERLTDIGEPGVMKSKAPLDQFGTYEVFVVPKEGKPFQHEGIVHAPNLELAFILAKEAFTRRFTCTSLCVVDTRNVYVSPLTEGVINVYDQMTEPSKSADAKVMFEVYHLTKRGKQHVHMGSVEAGSSLEAMSRAKQQFSTGKPVYNVWVIRAQDIRFTSREESDLWLTLPEKKFRDAAEYKGGDKLKDFLALRTK